MDRKPQQKRAKGDMERDMRLIADMYLRRIPQQDIATELELSPATVSRDLKKLQKEWQEARLYDMNEAKNRELARIDVLERQYWLGWERSQKNALSESEAIAGAGSVVTLHQDREQFGDPRFLNGIMSCIQKRCEILGLNAPKATDLPPGGTQWNQFINAQITVIEGAQSAGLSLPSKQKDVLDVNPNVEQYLP